MNSLLKIGPKLDKLEGRNENVLDGAILDSPPF
jgi:hypothetical protein